MTITTLALIKLLLTPITYPWKLLRRLINFICKKFNKEIDYNIESNELLVRGILHPIFYSNSDNAVRREAFLPPPNKNDVSLLRRRYTNDDFCKNHASKLVIGTNTYCGLATFHPYHLDTIYKDLQESDKILVIVKATPIDKEGNYIIKGPVLRNSSGLPMHADMLYDTPIIKGEPQTKHRKFASQLAKICTYFKDPMPESNGWTGVRLEWVKK